MKTFNPFLVRLTSSGVVSLPPASDFILLLEQAWRFSTLCSDTVRLSWDSVKENEGHVTTSFLCGIKCYFQIFTPLKLVNTPLIIVGLFVQVHVLWKKRDLLNAKTSSVKISCVKCSISSCPWRARTSPHAPLVSTNFSILMFQWSWLFIGRTLIVLTWLLFATVYLGIKNWQKTVFEFLSQVSLCVFFTSSPNIGKEHSLHPRGKWLAASLWVFTQLVPAQ